MSNRHRLSDTVPQPRVELRAHAHNERHRVHSEMHLVTEAVKHGLDPDDVIEPKQAWKPVHHHDADRGREKARRKPIRHWKMKDWKRRSAKRRAKAAAYRPDED